MRGEPAMTKPLQISKVDISTMQSLGVIKSIIMSQLIAHLESKLLANSLHGFYQVWKWSHDRIAPAVARAVVLHPVLFPQDRTLTVPNTGRMPGVQQQWLSRCVVHPVPRGARQAGPNAPAPMLPSSDGNKIQEVSDDPSRTGGGPGDCYCGGFGGQEAPRATRLHSTDMKWREQQQQSHDSNMKSKLKPVMKNSAKQRPWQ